MMLHVTHVDDSVRGRQGPCVYFWGEKTHDLSLLMKNYIRAIQKKLESRSPPLNVNELDIYQLYCVLINKEWVRARVSEPKLSLLGTIEVFCIDNGETHLIPLSFLRNVDITGIEADHIRKSPPLASKFILADMVKPQLPDSDSQWTIPAMNFLKAHLEDQSWEAVPLSNYAGVQIVRLYDAANELFVSRMVEQQLGAPSQTYQEAICMGKTLNEQPIPDITTVFKPFLTLNNISPVTVTEIAVIDLAAQESLFVIFSEEPGSFFGKLDKISLKDQDEMATELYNVYSSLPNPPLLYCHDKTSRLGHYGVLQSHGDQSYSYHSFRRVLVIRELLDGVKVYFIDYGNSLWISRFKILAPLDCLIHFRQTPHGIHCKLEKKISLKVSRWKSFILDKWVKVFVGVCVGVCAHQVTFIDDSLDEELDELFETETSPEDNGDDGDSSCPSSSTQHSEQEAEEKEKKKKEKLGRKASKRTERFRNGRKYERENRKLKKEQARCSKERILEVQRNLSETLCSEMLDSAVNEFLNDVIYEIFQIELDVEEKFVP